MGDGSGATIYDSQGTCGSKSTPYMATVTEFVKQLVVRWRLHVMPYNAFVGIVIQRVKGPFWITEL